MTELCCFCEKSQHEVRQLIRGTRGLICNECVLLCMDIIRPAEDAAAQKAAAEAALMMEKRRARHAELQAVMESNEALDRWLGNHQPWTPSGERCGRLAVTRASAYKTVSQRQEFSELWRSPFASDPRRPVVMRGSISMLQQMYTTKSGYHNTVVGRYIRFIRLTSIDFEEIRKIVSSANVRAMRLYPNYRDHDFYGRGRVYINGEVIYGDSLDPKKLAQLRKLTAIAQKVEKLDEKKEAALMASRARSSEESRQPATAAPSGPSAT